MSFSIVRTAARAERSDELHMARLLVLLNAAGGKRHTSVAGIMKLAKLDFLLRYPNCLRRAFKARGKDPAAADIKPHEENTIETRMIRFRYGPWDRRYRRWIALLVAKGLGKTYREGRTVHVRLTELGLATAQQLSAAAEFDDLSARALLVARAVGSMSATALKEFIYAEFPEIVALPWGEEIDL